VRSRWVRIGCAILLLSITVGSAAFASSLFGTTYNLGEDIQFKVEDSTIWWWGCCSCCSCTESLVSGWRIVNASNQVVYSVAFDAPVAASIWQGTWSQLDMNGAAVDAGRYMLYVDTSAGTLSRWITLRDPCACSWCTSSCSYCEWDEVPSITDCSCRTSLEFVEDCNTGCFSLFWWLGCSSSSSCSSCP
jgi:hypothetical protein